MIRKILRVLLRELSVNLNAWLYGRRTRSGRARAERQSRIEPGRVALVRLDRIGDFVLFTPALLRFRELLADKSLCLVGNALWQELALWVRDHGVVDAARPLFDDFIAVRPEGLARYRHFAEAARLLEPFETVVSTVFSRTNAVDKIVCAAPGTTIASHGDASNMFAFQKKLNDRRYDRLVPGSAATFHGERDLDLVRALSAEPIPSRLPRWIVPPELCDAVLQGLADRCGGDLSGPHAAVSPFTSVPLKEWPADRFATLVNRIHDDAPDLRVLLLGAPENVADARRLTSSIRAPERLLDLVGRTSLVELTAVLARARLAVSGDTAAAHLAIAVGTPTVTIVGGGQYGQFFPYPDLEGAGNSVVVSCEAPCRRCNWVCGRRVFRDRSAPCLTGIEVDQVHERVRALMQAGSAGERPGAAPVPPPP